MHRLRLLGSPSIVGDDGSRLAGPATHRHRLALLALLAVERSRPLSRDKVMAYLWPERDAEHARQLLNQAVYHLRKALGEGAILSTGEDLRLDPARVEIDVLEFERAAEEGRLEAAAALYAGPLLDGFFLDGTPEFEHWLDRARERLVARYAGILEALARECEAVGDFAGAVGWWKERAALDPYDSSAVLSLMEAMEADGNPAGALQQAAAHEKFLREELGMEAPVELRSLAERVRTESRSIVRPERRARAAAGRPGLDPVEQRGESNPRVVPRIGSRERPGRARVLTYGIPAILLVAAVYGWIRGREGGGEAPSSVPGSPSIVVLPLSNPSSDPVDAALADRMTEGVIANLARLPGLRVISSTSAFAFRNSGIDVRTIADSLGVAHVVEGSLHRVGSSLRVGVRLVDPDDGTSEWSETFDREISDIFAVEGEVAGAIARELGLRPGADGNGGLRRPPTHSVAAYEFYLRGSDPALLRSDSAAWEGVKHFRQAILMDSAYADAHAGMARLLYRAARGAPAAERDRYHESAEEHALKAVALDGESAEAQATLGVIQMSSFDLRSAEHHLLRAVALDPADARIHEWLVTLYLWKDRPDQALVHAEAALLRDPLSPSAHGEAARALFFNDRCDEALEHLAPLRVLSPPLLRAAPLAAQCHAHRREWTEAIALLRPEADRGDESSLGQLGFVYARSGQREAALEVRDRLMEGWEIGDGSALGLALVDAGLGDFDGAFGWLDHALTDRSLAGAPGDPAQLMIMSPLMEDLRRDPRFEGLRERLGVGAAGD